MKIAYVLIYDYYEDRFLMLEVEVGYAAPLKAGEFMVNDYI